MSKLIHLVQCSIQGTYCTVSGHRRCRPANAGFTRDLGLPQRCWCRFQSSGILLHVHRLEPTILSQKRIAFLCNMSNATDKPTYWYWMQQRGDCILKNARSNDKQVTKSQLKVEQSTGTSSFFDWFLHLINTSLRMFHCVVNLTSNVTGSTASSDNFNPLNTKRRLLYLKTQFVPRSKHFTSRL